MYPLRVISPVRVAFMGIRVLKVVRLAKKLINIRREFRKHRASVYK